MCILHRVPSPLSPTCCTLDRPPDRYSCLPSLCHSLVLSVPFLRLSTPLQSPVAQALATMPTTTTATMAMALMETMVGAAVMTTTTTAPTTTTVMAGMGAMATAAMVSNQITMT